MTVTVGQTLLARWMHEKGISADEVARALGYNAMYIQQIAIGYRPVSDKLLGALVRVYGPEVAEIVAPAPLLPA